MIYVCWKYELLGETKKLDAYVLQVDGWNPAKLRPRPVPQRQRPPACVPRLNKLQTRVDPCSRLPCSRGLFGGIPKWFLSSTYALSVQNHSARFNQRIVPSLTQSALTRGQCGLGPESFFGCECSSGTLHTSFTWLDLCPPLRVEDMFQAMEGSCGWGWSLMIC